MDFGRWQGATWMLDVRVQPRSSKDRIVGVHDGLLKIALSAPPVDGAANKALCRFLAGQLGVAKGRVAVVGGEKSRQKRIAVANPTREDVARFCASITPGQK